MKPITITELYLDDVKISNIESKKVQQSFSLAVLYRIAKALEIDISLLFVERDDYGNII